MSSSGYLVVVRFSLRPEACVALPVPVTSPSERSEQFRMSSVPAPRPDRSYGEVRGLSDRPWTPADRAAAAASVARRVSEHDRLAGPRIRAHRALGLSWRAVACVLESDGIPPPHGRWTHVAVRRIAARLGID